MKLKRIMKCSNTIANVFPADPPPPSPHEAKGQNSTFTEHGHVAYQIKGNHECSTMVANILPTDPYPPLPTTTTLQQHGSKYFACILPHHHPLDGVKGQNSTFSEHGHVAYQIKENQECNNMVANILPADPPTHTLTQGMGSIGQNSTFSEHGHVAYQIKGTHEMQQHGSKYFARRSPPHTP